MPRFSMRSLGLVLVVAVITAVWAVGTAAAGNRQIPASGTAFMTSGPTGVDGVQWPEFPGAQDSEAGPAPYNGTIVDRSHSTPGANGASVNSGKKAKSSPNLNLSFTGLNHRQNRLASGGNQFSLEPPDQGLCVGNGYALETVNDVLRVFDTAGNALTAPTALNAFYGYPPAINRTTGVRGPFVTDPSCYFDVPTQRWFHVVLTLDTTAGGAFTGPNHLDIAVSNTSSPLGAWTIYKLPVQDDGTEGTPNHHCTGGPCIGDYPHIGADANGFYITTNEYDFFGNNYISAQVYAISKAALAAHAASVAVTQFDTSGAVASTSGAQPGFTVWPTNSPASQYVSDAGGTEYFLSSNAADEATCPLACAGPGTSSELVVWALTNTSSLNTASPALNLSNTILNVNQYAVPPKATQKAGDFPLGQCLNDPSCAPIFLGGPDPFAPEPEGKLDSNDTRMQQTWYANGKIWGALDTAVTVGGSNRAGIAWYVVKPTVSLAGVSAALAKQGFLALAGNDVTYPAIAVTQSGRGVMGFTLTGDDNYPSAGYAAIDANVGVGDINVAGAGVGPQDGFTEYRAFTSRPRWGDYGAAVLDGNSIWLANEFIAQTCTLSQALATGFSCGGTRSSFGNWATRISKLTP